MKAEKNTISGAEALKKVEEIVKRIETEKAELQKEFEKVKTELEARASGTIKASGFNIKKVLEKDDNEIIAELKNRAKKLKNALAMPNYADAEFRKYSIIYLNEAMAEHIEERNAFNKRRLELEKELYEITYRLKEMQKERGIILDKFYNQAKEIGLAEEFGGIGLDGAECVMEQYKEKCDVYEIN